MSIPRDGTSPSKDFLLAFEGLGERGGGGSSVTDVKATIPSKEAAGREHVDDDNDDCPPVKITINRR